MVLELDALGDDFEEESELGIPSYLREDRGVELPDFIDSEPMPVPVSFSNTCAAFSRLQKISRGYVS